MSSKLASDGIELVKHGIYAEGINKITQALKEREAPLWLLERSKAYLRTQELDLALYDAEKALSLAFNRAARPLMTEAQLRRAITLYRLGRFADADVCATWTANLLKGARATEDDGQQNKVDENGDYVVTAKEVADENKVSTEEGMAAAMGGGGNSKDKSLQNQAYTWRIQALNAMEKTPAGSPGRKVTVVKYPTPSKTPPAATAKKAEPASAPAAQAPPATKPSTESAPAPVKTTTPAPAKPIAQQPKPVASGSATAKPAAAPSYPTSSKSGPKNWDLIAAEADEEEDESKNDPNAFFQKIYNGADPDSQRAMMKSFVESNGTALSTSWADAKEKNYQTQAPDGMEPKKWE